jgi:hypothetical protein
MPCTVYDLACATPEDFASLQDAMTALLARYPEAVFSDVDFAADAVIWVWPSNTASMHAAPADAVAWIDADPFSLLTSSTR